MTESCLKCCINCNEELEMSYKECKWVLYNEDGSNHDCISKEKRSKQTREEILEMVLKKLESIDIIINIEQIDKQQYN